MADTGPTAGGQVDLERFTVPELRALITQAEAKVREKQEKAKTDLLAKWKAEAEESGLSFQTLLPGVTSEPAKAARRSAGDALPAKYRGPNGEEWSGRGRLPKWLQTLEAEGKGREEFRLS